jgi:hypothetical protein
MSIGQINPDQCSNERGESRAFLSPNEKALLSLDEVPDEASHKKKVALALQRASTDQLKTSLASQMTQPNIKGALLVSEELTARGIAPCFRGISLEKLAWTGDFLSLILTIADLQWIVARYPDHVPEWERLKSLFDTKKFRDTAEYLHYNGRREPGQIAKALALTEDQQRECSWIQCLGVARWRERLTRRLPIAQSRIESAIRETDKRSSADQDQTIKRRSDLWLCAELGNWKPQRTADLYAMMTGEVLQRNAVANQLAKLPKVRRSDDVIAL